MRSFVGRTKPPLLNQLILMKDFTDYLLTIGRISEHLFLVPLPPSQGGYASIGVNWPAAFRAIQRFLKFFPLSFFILAKAFSTGTGGKVHLERSSCAFSRTDPKIIKGGKNGLVQKAITPLSFATLWTL